MIEHCIYCSGTAWSSMYRASNFQDFTIRNIYRSAMRGVHTMKIEGKHYGVQVNVLDGDVIVRSPKQKLDLCTILIGRVWTEDDKILHVESAFEDLEVRLTYYESL